jgi:predicted translin family RNA/ssDNA-binding protein
MRLHGAISQTTVIFKGVLLKSYRLDISFPLAIVVYFGLFVVGLQEFVEAVTFHDYLMNNSLQSWTKIQKDLNYTNSDVPTEDEGRSTATIEQKATSTLSSGSCDQNGSFTTLVSPVDYILGVADLTGELMRKCINNLGSGNVEGCYHTCTFVREIYSGFLSVNCAGLKEMSRKLSTLRQSLSKMENACYTIHVRGSEIPKHMLADVISGSQDNFLEEDEGFY